MDELLESLLEAEVFTEETATKLKEAMQVQVTEAIESAKEEAAAEVRAELTEEWVQSREALVEAVDAQVSDFMSSELEELKADIENFRDLEAEAADKLVEARAAMAAELKTDLVELVEKIDTFLEMRLTAELEELREDITEIRKNDAGRRIIEAFQAEVADLFASDDDSEATLAETKQRLADAEEALAEAEEKREAIERKVKMEEVLSPLAGRHRDVMEAILKTVDTENLESGYNTFIGRVVRETAEVDSEKEDKVLAEGAEVEKEVVTEGVVVTGDNEEQLNEEATAAKTGGLSDEERNRLRKYAGLA